MCCLSKNKQKTHQPWQHIFFSAKEIKKIKKNKLLFILQFLFLHNVFLLLVFLILEILALRQGSVRLSGTYHLQFIHNLQTLSHKVVVALVYFKSKDITSPDEPQHEDHSHLTVASDRSHYS